LDDIYCEVNKEAVVKIDLEAEGGPQILKLESVMCTPPFRLVAPNLKVVLGAIQQKVLELFVSSWLDGVESTNVSMKVFPAGTKKSTELFASHVSKGMQMTYYGKVSLSKTSRSYRIGSMWGLDLFMCPQNAASILGTDMPVLAWLVETAEKEEEANMVIATKEIEVDVPTMVLADKAIPASIKIELPYLTPLPSAVDARDVRLAKSSKGALAEVKIAPAKPPGNKANKRKKDGGEEKEKESEKVVLADMTKVFGGPAVAESRIGDNKQEKEKKTKPLAQHLLK